MNLVNVSNFVIPLLVSIILITAIYKGVKVYDVFIEGAKDGVKMGVSIFPYLLAMIVAINILLKSGLIMDLLSFLKPLLLYIGIPVPVVPMAIMRPLSGSSSLMLMNDIFVNYGPDSFLGILASTIQGSTDTTVYVLTLYFGYIGIKRIRYALGAGLCADLMGIIASILVVSWLF